MNTDEFRSKLDSLLYEFFKTNKMVITEITLNTQIVKGEYMTYSGMSVKYKIGLKLEQIN